jgi:putative membrane protein
MLTALTAAAPWAYGPGVGFFPFFFLIPLFWILLLVLVVVLLGRRRRRWMAAGGWGGWQQGRSAEATLAERFANGDIDEVEYRARLEVLRANREPMR